MKGGDVQELTKGVEEAQDRMAKAGAEWDAANDQLRKATAALQKALKIPASPVKGAYRESDAIVTIDIVLMILSVEPCGAKRWRDVGRQIGKVINGNIVYQKPYRDLTQESGRKTREITEKGKERLEDALKRKECQRLMEKIRQIMQNEEVEGESDQSPDGQALRKVSQD